MTAQQANEKFEATPLTVKVIAGLLLIITAFGTGWGASMSSRIDAAEQLNRSRSDTLAVHRMQILNLYELKADIKEIKADIKAIAKNQ